MLVGKIALLQQILRLVGALPLKSQVLFEHGLNVELGFAAVQDREIVAFEQSFDDLGGYDGNLANV